MTKEQKEWLDYDEFLKNEKNKLRDRNEKAELEHRALLGEKNKPVGHSSLSLSLEGELKLRENIKERARRVRKRDKLAIHEQFKPNKIGEMICINILKKE